LALIDQGMALDRFTAERFASIAFNDGSSRTADALAAVLTGKTW